MVEGKHDNFLSAHFELLHTYEELYMTDTGKSRPEV